MRCTPMSDTTTVHDQYYEMANAPINRIIPKLAVPTIISMLVTSIYNMADTFFVSQLGTSASGAIGIVFSAMAIIQALSFMVGMGSGNYIARSIGAGKRQLAEQVASVAFFTGLIIGLLIAILGNLSLRNVVFFLGATETIAPFAQDYARYIFLAAPFMVTSFIMNNLLRFQGKALFAMVGITTGGILNMILDPIFIFSLGLGTSGAALATALSQVISFCILLFMCNTKKECITIHPKNFRPTLSIYKNVIYGGIPSLGRQGIASVATIIMNIKVSTAILLVFCVTGFAFSGHIIELFRKGDPDVIRIGTLALRLQLVTLPLQGVIIMGNMMPQSIGYGIRATLVSIGRQGLFLIPALLILTPILGLLGIQISQPIADLCTFFLAAFVMNGIFKEMDAAK